MEMGIRCSSVDVTRYGRIPSVVGRFRLSLLQNDTTHRPFRGEVAFPGVSLGNRTSPLLSALYGMAMRCLRNAATNDAWHKDDSHLGCSPC